MKHFVTLISIAFLTAGCGIQTQDSEIAFYAEHYINDPNTSFDIKDAIIKGVVIKGMCPFQAFAAAGRPGPYMVTADHRKWNEHTPPPTIIAAQCSNPDNSIIQLMFRNKTQFNTEEPVIFRVKFVKGTAVLIDQKGFDQN